MNTNTTGAAGAPDSEDRERAWVAGQNATYVEMLKVCHRGLGLDVSDPLAVIARLTSERVAVVAALREVCGKHGDNDWPDDLHLADVVEKHLGRHL